MLEDVTGCSERRFRDNLDALLIWLVEFEDDMDDGRVGGLRDEWTSLLVE